MGSLIEIYKIHAMGVVDSIGEVHDLMRTSFFLFGGDKGKPVARNLYFICYIHKNGSDYKDRSHNIFDNWYKATRG